MRFVLFAVFTALTLNGAADAADKKPVADADKRLCRIIEKTGSIMPGRKQCHTRSEWAKIDGANEQNARDANDRNRSGMMPSRGE